MIVSQPFYNGILKSEDGGQNWQQITEGLATQASRMVSRLVIASPDGDLLYISTGLDKYRDPPKSERSSG